MLSYLRMPMCIISSPYLVYPNMSIQYLYRFVIQYKQVYLFSDRKEHLPRLKRDSTSQIDAYLLVKELLFFNRLVSELNKAVIYLHLEQVSPV